MTRNKTAFAVALLAVIAYGVVVLNVNVSVRL